MRECVCVCVLHRESKGIPRKWKWFLITVFKLDWVLHHARTGTGTGTGTGIAGAGAKRQHK
jgi:hypothetical protein